LRALLARCLEAAEIAKLPYALRVPELFEIEGRPLSLERLFSNLIDNALHYGRSVEVEGNVDRAAESVVIQVMDRGPGIVDELKAQVFEPYFRSGHQPSSVHVGLGLGIVRTIAQLHGGTVELKDRNGGGLCVIVSLPVSHIVTN